MIKKLNLSHLLIFLFFFASTALISAYISQYIYGYQPCVLCLYQRKPFFVIIAITLFSLAFFKSKKSKKIAIFLCTLSLLVNLGIASYHVGVEQKIFKGFSGCSAENLGKIQSLVELEIAIASSPSVKCDEPQFFFLGLSMAAWNVIFCAGLLLIILISYRIVRSQIVTKRS
jgi:disulfide bond formation protein DsbB